MSMHTTNSPEFQFSSDSTSRTGSEPASLTLLREQWLQALFHTAGASLHMDVGKDGVTLSVTIPLESEAASRNVALPQERSPPRSKNVNRNDAGAGRDVWLPLKIPSALRRRFRAAAWRRQIRSSDLLQMFMEEFTESGRMPSGKGVVQRGYGVRRTP
jgi:hypothetical protein